MPWLKSLKHKLSERVFRLVEPKIDKLVNKAVSRYVKEQFLKNRRFQEHLKVRLDAVGLELEFFKGSRDCRACGDRFELLKLAVERAKDGGGSGLWLEFGVSGGESINFIAGQTDKTVYGFDSFEGLPEDWVKSRTNTQPKGSMSQHHRLPPVGKNVELIKGWFHETLPGFLRNHPEPVSFVHIDSDLYSSAKTILDQLRFQNGSVIVFDEYYNYALWKEGEFKAFQEFLSARVAKAKCLGYNPSDKQAAFALEWAGVPETVPC